MSKVRMLEVTRKGKIIGTLRLSDLVTAGGLLADRLRYEIAHMEGGSLAPSILRGIVTNYSDGSSSIGPRDAKGKRSMNATGNLISYFVTPYDFDAATGERFKVDGTQTHTAYTKGVV